MNLLRIISVFYGMLIVTSFAIAQEEAVGDDPWAMVRALEGEWTGVGEGFGQSSKVTHVWRFVLGDKFLRLETKSVTEPASGSAEVHEDVGYVSRSEGDNVLLFRQFLSEGFVNTFRLEPAPAPEAGIDFEPVSTDGMENFSVRMTLRFTRDDAYEMVLAMGKKGSELKACQTMQLSRVR